MNGYSFSFCGAALHALPSGALWWGAERTLVVSDLHLGKSERFARKGRGLLPPYETRETLTRLDEDLSTTDPQRVICLGDSFDDLEASEEMRDQERLWLARMQAGRDWIWIEGNHDAGPVNLGGAHLKQTVIAGLTFRHIASAGAVQGEVSGHYHPKYRIPGAGPSMAALVFDQTRMILPAYGTFTGGMDAGRPPLRDLFADPAVAILTGRQCVPVPLLRDRK